MAAPSQRRSSEMMCALFTMQAVQLDTDCDRLHFHVGEFDGVRSSELERRQPTSMFPADRADIETRIVQRYRPPANSFFRNRDRAD